MVCDSGFFVRADGSKGSLGSVRLDYNAQYTRFLGPEVEDPKTEGLPRLIGYGDAKWLSAAMSEDAELFRLVTELTKLGVGDASNLEIRVEEILLRWYRADGIASLSRGPHIDARRLTALERMQGTPWRSDNGSPNPNASEGAALNAEWRNQVAYKMIRLLAQIPLGDTLIPGVEYQALAFIVLPKDASPEATLANFRQQAPGGPNAKQRYWRVMAQLLYAMYPQFKETLPKERQEQVRSRVHRPDRRHARRRGRALWLRTAARRHDQPQRHAGVEVSQSRRRRPRALWRDRHAPPPIFPPTHIFSCNSISFAHIACVTTPNARAPGPLWFMQRRYASFLAKPASQVRAGSEEEVTMIATRQGGPAPCNIVSLESVISGPGRGSAALPAGDMTLSPTALSRSQRQM